MVSNRNSIQADVKDKAERSKTYSAVERVIARNLASWQDWVDCGYAAAFDDAWRSGMRPSQDGNVDHIVTFVLAAGGTKSSVRKNT